MREPKLRVYWPEDSDDKQPPHAAELAERVNVPLSEILPLLMDAVRSRRAFVLDFENEEVTISADLYEVLLAYEHYRPTA